MDPILVKIFAMALTFSQVATEPDTVKVQFDPVQDQAQVVRLLRAGCASMRHAFDIEDLNIDDLIATAMQDPDALSGAHVAFRGIKIADLYVAYRQFCKNETIKDSPVDLAQVIEFYNRTLADLPDHTRLDGLKLPGASAILDLKGARFAEIFEQDQRRVWVALSQVPEKVQRAFVAAEDKRFYQHKGVDERALIRAFIGNLAQSGRPQGGSTITQQVVKNLLVGEEVTYERKMREMILASRIEHTLTKPQILELYLNSIFLGRGAWGIETAAQSYFGKHASELTVSEGALLAGLVKGPNYFNPDRRADRARERYTYVLDRMQEDGVITADEARATASAFPTLVPYEGGRNLTGSYFADQVARELKTADEFAAFRVDSYTVRSTLHPDLQRAAEAALQEGLARYERNSGRVEFHGPEGNLGETIGRLESQAGAASDKPSWQQALQDARLGFQDVQWPPAVVLGHSPGARNGGGPLRVGLADGRVLALQGPGSILRTLKTYDVVLVRVSEGKGRSAQAELRVRPVVQGAALVLENKTGRVLAMVGGFSYALSQLNRTTQSQRQPGSALKPLTYLAALQKGLQPNTLVRDADITLPPIDGSKREQDYWSPKNYDGGSSGIITLRRALENSKNLATVHLLDGGIAATPPASLDRVCALAREAQLYKDCDRHYPFVLGAQPVRPIDLAVFYATIANEGSRPVPYVIDAIEQNGKIVYRHGSKPMEIASADHASFYQLKTMLQGVLQRGTARRIAGLAPYVAGKTGTSSDENDVWFVGFTNDVTVAIWVGYDNADGKRRTLGSGQTGGGVAVPIFEPIIQAVWTHYAPKVALAPPSPQAKRLLVTTKVGRESDEPRGRSLVEYLRRDAKGRPMDTPYALVSQRSEDGEGRAQRPRRYHQQPSQYTERPGSAEWAARAQQRSPWGFGDWGGWGWQDQSAGRTSYQGPRNAGPARREIRNGGREGDRDGGFFNFFQRN